MMMIMIMMLRMVIIDCMIKMMIKMMIMMIRIGIINGDENYDDDDQPFFVNVAVYTPLSTIISLYDIGITASIFLYSSIIMSTK
jgi:hypothetical protein